MAKQIGSWRVMITGSGDGALDENTSVSIRYDVASDEDSDLRTRPKGHQPQSPSWAKTVAQFVADEIAAIKTAEGIS